MLGYIVYQESTGLIYGTGETLEQATADAREWADDPTLEPEYCLRRSGEWRWSYATRKLVAAVRFSGGDLVWNAGASRGFDIADVRPL